MIKSCLLVVVAIIVAAVLVWKALHVSPVAAPEDAAITPALKAEFEKHRRQFQTEEDYRARLAGQHLDETALKARIAAAQAKEQALEKRLPRISEAEARAWYDAHKESLRIPPAFHAAHVFLTRHEKAKPDREAEMRAIHQRLAAGGITFAAAAAQFSEDERTKTLQGDLGWFTAARMQADFMSQIDKMRPGELSRPFLTGLGWHVVKMIETRPSRLPTFEEAMPEIVAALEWKAREAALVQP